LQEDTNNKIVPIAKIRVAEDEQILSLDQSQLMGHLVYGGKKCQIGVYDQEKLELIKSYEKGDSYCYGHTNRIFKVKCVQD
jgi:hypothetical protein